MKDKVFIQNPSVQNARIRKLARLSNSGKTNINQNDIAIINNSGLVNLSNTAKTRMVDNAYRKGAIGARADFSKSYADIFTAIGMDNLQALTAKVSTGNNLMQAGISFAAAYNATKESLTKEEALAAIENYRKFDLDHSIGAYFLDTETLSGTVGGRQQFDQITEYAAVHFNPDHSIEKKVTNLIGVENTDYYKKMIGEGGNFVPGELRTIAATWFARLGHSGSTITRGDDGRWTGDLVGEKTQGLLTKENISRGLGQAHRMFEDQEKTKTADGLTIWQADMLNMSKEIQTATTPDQNGNIGAVVSGHNTVGFDYRKIDTVLYRGIKAHPDTIGVYANKIGYTGFNPPKNSSFDVLSAVRLADLGGNFAADLYGNNKVLEGSTPYTQESLNALRRSAMSEAERAAEDDYMRAFTGAANAHQALTDLMNSQLVASMKLPNGQRAMDLAVDYINQLPDTMNPINIGNHSQLLHMTQGLGGNLGDSLFGFIVDPLDGKIHTNDGSIVGFDGYTGRDFASYVPLAKKGANYTMSMSALPANGAMMEQLQQLYPGMAGDDLMLLEMRPDFGNVPINKKLLKSNMSSYLVGRREDIVNKVNEIAIPVATGQSSGKGDAMVWTPIKAGVDLARPKTAGNLEAEDYDKWLKDIRQSGAEINAGDTAARMIREEKPSRIRALMRVNQAVKEQIGVVLGSNATPTKTQAAAVKDQIFAQLQQATLNVAAQSTQGPLLLPNQTEVIKSMQELAGWGENKTITRGTYDNILASYDYFDSIAPHVQELLQTVDELIGNMPAGEARNAYERKLISSGLGMLYGAASEKMEGNPDRKAVGFREYEKNYYELDVSSIKSGKSLWTSGYDKAENNADNILRIDLRKNGDFKLLDDARALSGANEDGVIEEVEIRKKLQQVARLAHISGGKNLDNDIYARYIIGNLRQKKDKNFMAGIINNPQQMQVLAPSDIGKLVSVDEARNIFQQLKTPLYSSAHFGDITKDYDLDKETNFFVENYLMPSISSEQRSQMYKGLTADQTKWLDIVEGTHRKDMRTYAKTLLGGIRQAGYGFVYDANLGYVSIYDKKKNAYFDISDLVPKFRYRDGTYYLQVGQNTVAANLEMKMGAPGNELGMADVSSHIGLATRDSYKLSTLIRNMEEDGRDTGEAFNIWGKRIVRSLRTGSSINFSAQDKNLQFELGMGGMIDALPELLNTPEFSLIPAEDRKKMLELINKRRSTFSHDNLSSYMKDLIGRNLPGIAQIIQHLNNPDLAFAGKNMSAEAKKSSMEQGRVAVTERQKALDVFNKPGRDINNLRVVSFDANKAQQKLNESGVNVSIGNPIQTEFGRRNTSGTLDDTTIKTDTQFVLDRTFATDSLIKENVTKTAAEEIRGKSREEQRAILRAAERIKVAGHTVEENAIGDIRILDSANVYNYQKVGHSKKLKAASSLGDYEQILRDQYNIKNASKVIPKFEIGQDGSIVFTYRKGRFVSKTEEMLELVGYGNSVEHELAKNPGILKMGFFAKNRNLLVSEKDVMAAVEGRLGKNIGNVDQFVQTAGELFDFNFYLDKAESNVYKKTVENLAEKHMTTFMGFGIGESGNSKIVKAMQNLGLGTLVTNRTMLNTDLLAEFSDVNALKTGMVYRFAGAGQMKKNMRKMKRALKTQKLGFDQFVASSLASAGFGSMDEFYSALLEERALPSVLLQKSMGGNYITASKIQSHGSMSDPIISGLLTSVNNRKQALMRERGLSPLEAEALAKAEVFSGAANGELLLSDNLIDAGGHKHSAIHFNSKTGEMTIDQLHADQGAYLDYEKAKGFFKGYGVDLEDMYKNGGNNRSLMGFIDDWEGSTSRRDFFDGYQMDWDNPNDVARYNLDKISKGAKVTDRELNMMELATYDQKYIDTMHSRMGDAAFRELFTGKVTYDQAGRPVLREEFAGKSILSPITNAYRSQLFYHTGETELTASAISADRSLSHLSKFISEEYKAKNGYDRISIRKAQELYTAAMGSGALWFNNGRIDRSRLESAGNWNVVNIGEFNRATGGDYRELMKDPNSALGKNILLNLKDDPAFDDEMLRSMGLNRNDGLLAIGRPPDSHVGNEAILNEQYSAVNQLLMARNRIINIKSSQLDENGELTEVGREQLANEKENARAAVEKFKARQNSVVLGKGGYMSNAAKIELAQSFSGKVSVMAMSNLANEQKWESGALRKIKIDGKNLFEHAKNGALFDVKLVSREKFQDLGMFEENYMRSLFDRKALDEIYNSSDSEAGRLAELTKRAERKYKTEGFMSMTHRFPSIYSGTMRPVQVFMSDDVKNAQMISMIQGAVYSKSDSDGDLEYIAKIMGHHDGKEYDSLQASQLSGQAKKAASVEMQAGREAYYKAAYIDNAISRQVAEEDMKIANDINGTFMANALSDRYVFPHSSRFITPEKLTEYQDAYNSINSKAMELASAGENISAEQAAALFKDDKDIQTRYLRKALEDADSGTVKAVQGVLNSMEERAVSIGKFRQSSAGEISLAAFQMRKMREMSKQVEGSQFTQQQHYVFDELMEAAEEGFLSPKHSDRTIVENIGLADEFHEIMRSMSRKEDGAKEQMVDWMERNAKNRIRSVNVMNAEGRLVEKNEISELSSEHIRQGVDMMEQLFNDLGNQSKFNNSTLIGARKFGVNQEAVLDAFIYPEEDKGSLMNKISNSISSYYDYDFSGKYAGTPGVASQLEDAYETAERNVLTQRASIAGESVVGAISHSLKNMDLSSKSLAVSALGIAASLMVTGFVGGNPAQPADGQAQQEQGSENVYAIPQLTATNQLMAQGGPQQGYVININAQTDKGRQQAERAIKQALASQGRSKVNIAMNIRDDTGNINDSSVERMIEGALG